MRGLIGAAGSRQKERIWEMQGSISDNPSCHIAILGHFSRLGKFSAKESQ